MTSTPRRRGRNNTRRALPVPADGGRPQPERLCIISREQRPAGALIRFVLAPDGLVTPDLKRELPGRGVWVTAERHMIEEAVRKNAFARGFKQQVRLPDDLAGLIATLLAERALALLSFANRAGLVTTGFEKVGEAIARKRIALLLEAADGAADGRRKLEGKLLAFGTERVEIVDVFTGEQLSLALGRSNVIHAALSQDRLTDAFLIAAHRYEHYLSASGRSVALQDR